MNRNGLALATTLSLLTFGCATPLQGSTAQSADSTATAETAETAAADTKATPATDDTEATTVADVSAAPDATATLDAAAKVASATRNTGDFVVYRFTGSFSQTPLTLTERVLSRTANSYVLSLTLDDGKAKEALEATLSDAPETRGDVLAVTRIDDGVRVEGSPEDYSALLSRVTLSADQNEALLSSEDAVVNVGGTPIDCHKTVYRVRVGKREAVLSTVESDHFAWGDVGGEIRTTAGKVLFKAEVVAHGNDAPKGAALAQGPEDEYE